jgi:hypothetical protein
MAGNWRAAGILALLSLVPGGTVAQEVELPPGVLLLSQVKRRIRQELEQLPEYTCLETVERSITPLNAPAGKPKSGQAKTELEPLDTLRLEVLYTGKKELYASPGARNFREEGPSQFIASGMIGDGVFASQLHAVFVSETALFTFRGEETITRERGWGRAIKYDFRIPVIHSGWHITLPYASGIIGEKGSFWVDPETQDLLRLEIHGDEIPPELALRDVVIASSYGRMRIGSEDIMLPQSAELRMIQMDGRESLDQFDFTHCRSYRAESSIRFETDAPVSKAEAPAPGAPVPVAWETLPAGLIVPITLTTEVGNDATVGMLLEGRVAAEVDFQGKPLIPEGAVVRGRVRRLERYPDFGGVFAVGLEFTEVQAGGRLLRFYADLQSTTGAPSVAMDMSNMLEDAGAPWRAMVKTMRMHQLPGVGSFFVRGTKLNLPPGFRMQWKTRDYGK